MPNRFAPRGEIRGIQLMKILVVKLKLKAPSRLRGGAEEVSGPIDRDEFSC